MSDGEVKKISESTLSDFLCDLAKAPVGQIAESEVIKIKELVGKPAGDIASGLELILFDCCEYSLASDFAMGMLEIAFSQAIELSA